MTLKPFRSATTYNKSLCTLRALGEILRALCGKINLSTTHPLKIKRMEHHALLLVELDSREGYLDEIQAVEQEFQKV